MSLTEHQRNCLRLIASGETVKQAARILDRAPVSIEDSLKRTRIALGARNSTHAVSIAIRGGLI